jgi:hypothetical protein
MANLVSKASGHPTKPDKSSWRSKGQRKMQWPRRCFKVRNAPRPFTLASFLLCIGYGKDAFLSGVFEMMSLTGQGI